MILNHALGCVECGGACRGLGSCNSEFGSTDFRIPGNQKLWEDCVKKEQAELKIATTIEQAISNWNVATPMRPAVVVLPSIAPKGIQIVDKAKEAIQPGLNILKTESLISGVPNWVFGLVAVVGVVGFMGRER